MSNFAKHEIFISRGICWQLMLMIFGITELIQIHFIAFSFTFQIPKHAYYQKPIHYSDVIMGVMASQITSLTIIYSIIYLGADQRKHQSSASLAFVLGIHQWPVTQKMFIFDYFIMKRFVYKSRVGTVQNIFFIVFQWTVYRSKMY